MKYQLINNDSLLREILSVVEHAVDEGRNELNDKEIEFVQRMTKRMVMEYKKQLSAIASY
ncbi:MAG: hypothetical protein IH841_04535 [Thaumarchaeota archaeon]|nr:hypothetical protein [Nitrososphaerota archaeon]